jgi:hypothetical protein
MQGSHDEQHLICIEALGFGERILRLAIDDGRWDQHPDEHGKLQDDQRLANTRRRLLADDAPQHGRRPEGGEDEGGIGARENAEENTKAATKPEERISVSNPARWCGRGTCSDAAGARGKHEAAPHADDHIDGRLADELRHQVAARGARGLSHADLGRAAHGAGGHEVDEIDRGGEYNQNADAATA